MPFPALLTQDHRDCDVLLSTALERAEAGLWEQSQNSFSEFCNRIESHFRAEESILFRRFEELTGMTHGPTKVMRLEHDAVREAFDRINDAILDRDSNAVLGEIDALFLLLQQHNLKEESILYPAAERAAGPDATQLESDLHQALAGQTDPIPRGQ